MRTAKQDTKRSTSNISADNTPMTIDGSGKTTSWSGLSAARSSNVNPYEESELEARDLYCDHCGKLITSHEHYEYCGLCVQCYEIMYMGEWRKIDAADRKSVEF